MAAAKQAYGDGPRAHSRGACRLVARRFDGLQAEMGKCDRFVGKLASIKTEQDNGEYRVMAWFLTERAMPFSAFWHDAMTKGGSFSPADVPRWFDEE
jgi:hypothetical protein